MIQTGMDARGRRLLIVGQRLSELGEAYMQGMEDWVQASPVHIREALERASQLPTGGWYALDASRRITTFPSFFWVKGQQLVAWRVESELRVAPDRCPHMKAPLSCGCVREGKLVCPWHGLALDRKHGRWSLLESHDDGVLAWVRLEDRESPTDRPIVPTRPTFHIDGVVRMIARCSPADVIANRLDPWHGAHFHPHSFARLKVIDAHDDRLTLRVAFRVLGPVCVEVDCTFHCPDARTIVMTIVDGEGRGSLVETHATPLVDGWTAIVEATLVTSERPGFHVARRLMSPLIRTFAERSARRLWVEDSAYCERTFHLRSEREAPFWVGIDPFVAPGTPKGWRHVRPLSTRLLSARVR